MAGVTEHHPLCEQVVNVKPAPYGTCTVCDILYQAEKIGEDRERTRTAAV